MSTGFSIQVLGALRTGQYYPCLSQPTWCFEADRVALGSTAWGRPALVLHDSSVSPKHALLERCGQGWIVRDLDSDNGIHSIRFLTSSDDPLPEPRQALELEFTEELCCCIGAIVLKFRTLK
jgi:hypothetical protein